MRYFILALVVVSCASGASLDPRAEWAALLERQEREQAAFVASWLASAPLDQECPAPAITEDARPSERAAADAAKIVNGILGNLREMRDLLGSKSPSERQQGDNRRKIYWAQLMDRNADKFWTGFAALR